MPAASHVLLNMLDAATAEAAGEFAPAVRHLADPALATLREDLRTVEGLSADEREVLLAAARRSWYAAVRQRVTRVLLLELHAERLSGRLTGPTAQARWADFLARSAREAFWADRALIYPTLAGRLDQLLSRRRHALLGVARRVTADRDRLPTTDRAGRLVDAVLDAGDSHRGQTVAHLVFEGGRVLYKPRSLRADRALAELLARLVPGRELAVPDVVLGADPDGYGYAAFVSHRYAADADEERRFYWAFGGWLAVMRLLLASDLHAENVVAVGPVPVVVDCETLFSPVTTLPPSPAGDAVDRAVTMVRTTVLQSGLLPWRQSRLALRGADMSAVGALPGQQPRVALPSIVDAGTDMARLVMTEEELTPAQNHPVPDPHPERFVNDITSGFRELAGRITDLDSTGELHTCLAAFVGCPLRAVVRATQAYVEIGRMLWHPASLADEPVAIARAADILDRHTGPHPGPHTTGSPGLDMADPQRITAEVDDLLHGDIPIATFSLSSTAQACDAWRTGNLAFEESLIRASLAGVYLVTSTPTVLSTPDSGKMHAGHADRLDERANDLAAQLVGQLCDRAIFGDDGTVTWIGPALYRESWLVRPLGHDLYSGQSGVVLALAAYARRHGSTDARLARTLEGSLSLLGRFTAPDGYHGVGAYTGFASGVWTWLLLHRLTGRPDTLDHACRLAADVADHLAADNRHDVLSGAAGTIVPLLALAECTGDNSYLEMACRAGDILAEHAIVDGVAACWPTMASRLGVGGFAHGSAGIGWALARLALVTGDSRHQRLATRAFAHQDSFWYPKAGGWLDIREPDTPRYPATWCNGSAGIALATWDLHQRTGDGPYLDMARRGAAHVGSGGFGRSHTLCHGDLASWEVLDTVEPDEERLSYVVSSLEEHGPITGITGDALSPGLMTGLAGIVYQLLRATAQRPDLPSVLLPGSL